MRRHVVSDSETEVSAPSTAFWGLDLDALRRSNGPLIAGTNRRGQDGPPIHKPLAPRNYLLKAMIVVGPDGPTSGQDKQHAKAITTTAKLKEKLAEKEDAAAIMLKAIDIVCQSWATSVTKEELDQKAQSWYMRVRPDVDQGQAGWGQRGQVHLCDILRLKKG